MKAWLCFYKNEFKMEEAKESFRERQENELEVLKVSFCVPNRSSLWYGR